MKLNTTLLVGLAAAAIATQASATDYTIRITGSTAFRSNTDSFLTTTLGFTSQGYTGTSASGAKYKRYFKAAYPTASDNMTIKTSWTGSVAGIQTVAQQRTDVVYLKDTASGTGLSETTDTEVNTTPPDIGFSDCYQSSTTFKTPALVDTICGIVQFRMVTGYGVGGVNPITSITYQQSRALFQSGSLPLSVFTGNPADTAKVYGIGRDPDSGTRVTHLSETGIGANSTVVHWQPTVDGTNTSVTALAPWPVQTTFGVQFDEGNGGYPSGGDLAKVMRLDTSSVSVNGAPAAPCYFIAMVGKSDASGTVLPASLTPAYGSGPGKIITCNNADSSSLTSAQIGASIKEGVNPLWSYLHCVRQPGLTGVPLDFYNALTAALIPVNSSDIILSQMKVQRLSDGGTILPK